MTCEDALFIDVESRSLVVVTDVGPYVYWEHPSTEALCACWRIGTTGDVNLWVKGDDIPVEWIIHEGPWVAHNKDFEQQCLKRIAPQVRPAQWIDTAVLYAIAGMPRKLGEIAKALHLEVKKLSNRAMLRLCKPQKPTEKRPQGGFVEPWEEPETYQELYVYCEGDVEVMSRIIQRLPPYAALMPATEWRLERLTDEINARGVPVDMVNARAAKAVVDQHIAKLQPEWEELMPGILPNSPTAVARALELPNCRADTIRDAMKTATGKRLRAMEVRQDITRSSVAKLDSIFDRTTADSRIHGSMVFHGAGRTGRFSSMGVQLNNFPAGVGDETDLFFTVLQSGCVPDFYQNPISAVSGALKGFLKGPLWAADFSQIEPRVLAKLAGDEAALDVFRQDKDPYLRLAAFFFAKPESAVSTKDTTDSRGRVVKSERFIFKTAELACGYGIGKVGFRNQLQSKYDVTMGEEEAARIVGAYRGMHPKIVNLWKNVEKMARLALSTQSQTWVKDPEVPGIAFRVYRAWLCLRLPSGRVLWYFEPSLEAGAYGMEIHYWGRNVERGGHWERVKTYGGKLVENITQAVARDIMAEAMLRLDDAGEQIVFMVHDEIVGLDLGTPAETVAGIMTQQPSFWTGIPLKVGINITERYQK